MKKHTRLTVWLCIFAMLVSVFALASCQTKTEPPANTTESPTTEGTGTTAPTPAGTTGNEGDTPAPTPPGPSIPEGYTLSKMPIGLTFGEEKGNEAYFAASSEKNGLYEYVAEKDAIKIGYSTQVFTKGDGGNYAFMPKFEKAQSALTDDYKYVRVWYSAKHAEGVEKANFAILNNAGGPGLRWDDLTDTDGFVLSGMQVNADSTLIRRFASGMHCTFCFYSDTDGAEYYIRAVFFFDNVYDALVFTEADAAQYMSEREDRNAALNNPEPSAVMTFAGTDATAKALTSSAENGTWVLDDTTGAIKLTRNSADTTSDYATAGYGYRAFLQFNQTGVVWNGVANSEGDRHNIEQLKDGYVRILYKLTLPAGTDSVDLALLQDDNKNMKIEWKNLTATTGFVLSSTAEFPVAQAHIGRFMRCDKEAFALKSNADGIEFEIKGVYFFTSPMIADKYEYTDPDAGKIVAPSAVMSFAGAGANAAALESSTENGTWEMNDGAIKLTRNTADTTSAYATAGYGYRAFLQFNEQGQIWNGVANSQGDRHEAGQVKDGFIRVLYSLKLPAGTDSVKLALLQDNDLSMKVEWTLTETSGYILSSTVEFPMAQAHIGRIMRCEKEAFALETNAEGVEFEILGVYFFTSQADADAFTYFVPAKTVVGLTFGLKGTANPNVTGNTSGATFNSNDNSYVLSYKEGDWCGLHYYFLPLFASGNQINENHKYIRILYRYSGSGSSIKIVNHANGSDVKAIAVTNTNGEFVLTDTEVLQASLISRFMGVLNCSVGFTESNSDLTCEIKGIFFFESEEEANAFVYVEPEPDPEPVSADAVMTFAGTAAALESSADNGTWTMNDGAIKLTRNSADTTSAYATAGYGYRAFLQFNEQGQIWNGVANSQGDRHEAGQVKDGFIRVLYKLTLPAGTDSVTLALLQDNDLSMKVEWANLTATDGYVLTSTAEFPVSQAHIGRIMRCEKEAFALETNAEGVEFEILGVYFFTSQAAADAFTVGSEGASAVMTFAGTAAALESSADNGTWTMNDGAVKLTRNSADTTSAYATAGYGYRAFLQFNEQGQIWNGVANSQGDRHEAGQVKDGFIRVLYKLTLPAGTDSVTLALLQDNDLSMKVEWANLTATDGYVLTSTAEFPVSQAHIGRIMRCEKEAFALETNAEGVEFEILGVYFFTTQAEADAFTIA